MSARAARSSPKVQSAEIAGPIMTRSRPPISDLAADRERAFSLVSVSRETAERLDAFIELLLKWQRITHLIASNSVPNVWTRHVADSLQLLDLAPEARTWVDLGSGGGFPGVVIACALAQTPALSFEPIDGAPDDLLV